MTNMVDTAVTTNGYGGRMGYYLFTGLPYGSYRVDVDLGMVPASLPMATTLTSIQTNIGPENPIVTVDFGFIPMDPTAIELTSFTAELDGEDVLLAWATAVELDTLGFNIYRSEAVDGERIRVNGGLIIGRGAAGGAEYQLLDTGGYVRTRLLLLARGDRDRLRYGGIRPGPGQHNGAGYGNGVGFCGPGGGRAASGQL